MKQYIYITFILILSSCTDSFLTLYPDTTLNEGNFYQSEEEYILLANGCYISLRNMEKNNHWVITELASDNLGIQYCATSGEATRGVIDNFLVSANNETVNNFWSTCYTGVYRCSKLLQELERATIQWSSEALRARCIGEALFLRGMYYFNLVRQYGGVPLVTTPLAGQDAVNVKRSTEEAIYQQVISDLQEAIAQLEKAQDYEEDGRANETAAKALLAKVYLTLQNYEEAGKLYRSIIQAEKYILLPEYADLFNPAQKDFKETIFSAQYSESTSGLSQRFIFLHAPNTSKGDVTQRPNININWAGLVRPTQDLLDAFEPGDKRKEVSIGYWYGPDWDNTVYDIPYCAKYKPPISAPDDRCGDNFPIIRYSDVLLSYAEVLNEMNQTADAIPFVRQVRTRAGLETRTSYTQQELRTLIEKERQVEFCFENHRWYDLKRTGRALEVMKEHGIREKARKTFIPANAFEMESYKLLLPIPAEQIQINGLEQNPGY
ncbi:MAG: RagB/SusD family nutrient uptake outer membrane protein [Tannerellaceae bacterium]|nr:RagB/SusD family nutrient uptake outer membrane protein [Tannerellaceae bacterium]